MGLLNMDERQELIDLLCQLLPDMYYPHSRLWLVATLPDAIRDKILLGGSMKSDITSIVDIVSDGSYTHWELSKDMYPILVVIKNAKGIVGGGPLADKLNQQMGIFKAKFGLHPEEISTPESPSESVLDPELTQESDQFLKELYNFIQKLPGIGIQLDSIRRTFDRYLIKQKCLPIKTRLINTCNAVHEFTDILKQSKDSKITNNSTSLRIALSSFENHAMIAEKNIGRFCEDCGTKMEKEQPAGERRKLQEDIDNLIKCSHPLREAAQNLYTLLSSYYSGKR